MKIEILGKSIDLMLIISPILYIIIGTVIFKIIKNILLKTVNRRRKSLKGSQIQRIQTLTVLIVNIIKYIIVILVTLAILSVFGFKVGSILAGLGIGTAIIGLAFQDVAKDLIAGFSIITEGSYEIGDTIEIGDFMGEVVFIGLRTTRIRNYKGATKIVANHYMDNIINYSEHNSLAVVDVSVAYEAKAEKVDEILEKLFKNIKGKLEYATKDPEVWGINDLGDSGVIYRIAVETQPMKQFVTERALRKEIKKAFDEAGIKIPYTQIEVHNGK